MNHASTLSADCANEPIHIPGSIQPHGLLFLLDSETFDIRQTSENTQALIGAAPGEVLGKPFLSFVPESSRDQTAAFLREAAHTFVNPFRVPVTTPDGIRTFDGIVHILPEAGTVLELEAAPNQSATALDGFENHLQIIQRSLQQCADMHGPDEIAKLIAREVREFTGFDRVMIYRFAPDYHGEVIAEACLGGVDSYLGLHFPATDIPAQARELYLRNTVRLLPDVNGIPAPLTPATPLDLSRSVLRSMSPVHVEYLRNMGVAASMSVSLILNGRLWGLIACHHRTPRFVSYTIRATASLYAMVMIEQIRAKETTLRGESTAGARRMARNILSKLRDGPETPGVLRGALPDFTDMFQAEGAALVGSGQISRCGCAPDEGIIAQLHEALASETGVIITHTARARFPFLADNPDHPAGLVAIHIGGKEWLMLFRKEFRQQVRWAGDPGLSKQPGADGRLHPRNSFSEWIEKVNGEARPWPENTPPLTTEVRAGLLEFIQRRNTALERSNQDLRRFAGVVAHEVKNQLQSGIMAMSLLSQKLGDSLDSPTQRLAELGTASLEDLARFTDEMLRFASETDMVGEITHVNLGEVTTNAIEELRASGSTNGAEIVVNPLPCIRAHKTQVRHVVSNLVRNAISHAADGTRHLRIEVGFRDDPGGETVVFVRDNGRGIPEEKHAKIFDYFYRGDERNGGGTGIGLAFCAQVVRRMGQRIWVEDSPGTGATFCFTVEVST